MIPSAVEAGSVPKSTSWDGIFDTSSFADGRNMASELEPTDLPDACQALRFVVQKHFARTLHFDFRLEKEGTFKSWALPKGMPKQVGEKRLAIQVDDHTLEFGEFEGSIPDGEYGAGQIDIWDRGNYRVVDWQDDHILIGLHGRRCRGRFRLLRFPRGGPRA